MVASTERTHAGRVSIEFIGLGRVQGDGFFPGVEDEGVIDHGTAVFSDGEESERDRPNTVVSSAPGDCLGQMVYQMV